MVMEHFCPEEVLDHKVFAHFQSTELRGMKTTAVMDGASRASPGTLVTAGLKGQVPKEALTGYMRAVLVAAPNRDPQDTSPGHLIRTPHIPLTQLIPQACKPQDVQELQC